MTDEQRARLAEIAKRQSGPQMHSAACVQRWDDIDWLLALVEAQADALEDYQIGTQHALMNHQDEVHCGCVPLLLAEIERIKRDNECCHDPDTTCMIRAHNRALKEKVEEQAQEIDAMRLQNTVLENYDAAYREQSHALFALTSLFTPDEMKQPIVKLIDTIRDALVQRSRLAADNARLRAALEQYADHYQWDDGGGRRLDWSDGRNGWEIAEAALRGEA